SRPWARGTVRDSWRRCHSISPNRCPPACEQGAAGKDIQGETSKGGGKVRARSVRKLIRVEVLGLLAIAAVAALAAIPALSADHLDAPTGTKDGPIDMHGVHAV